MSIKSMNNRRRSHAFTSIKCLRQSIMRRLSRARDLLLSRTSERPSIPLHGNLLTTLKAKHQRFSSLSTSRMRSTVMMLVRSAPRSWKFSPLCTALARLWTKRRRSIASCKTAASKDTSRSQPETRTSSQFSRRSANSLPLISLILLKMPELQEISTLKLRWMNW